MPEVPVIAAIEVVKLLMRTILEFVRANNLSSEEMHDAWNAALLEFNQNDPDNLPDV